MTERHIRSYLAYPELPFKIVKSEPFGDYEKVWDTSSNVYLAKAYTSLEYASICEMYKYSSHLKQPVYELKDNGIFILFFEYEALTEEKVKVFKILNILKEVHQKSSFELTLKKEHLSRLNHLYKVLDNKFSYFELRIRELETSPVKNDISWVILAKYNVILDARLYLYDLQQDLFKIIDKNEIVKYGLIYKTISTTMYSNGRLLPSEDIYFAPIAMLYCRMYLSLNEIDIFKDIEKLDGFNQKYFCFMVLYIFILNLNLEVKLHPYSVANYILITRKIKDFILKYKVFIEK